ncbi:Cytoplasmic tRNA 2-thiolation protein 2, partial [Kappamyces sp. JEL0680]
LLAVSGGPSSRCLLDLFASFSQKDPSQPHRRCQFPEIIVCHVDQSSILNNPELEPKVAALAKTYRLEYCSVSLEDLHGPERSADDAALSLKHSIQTAGTLSSQEDLLRIYTLECLYRAAQAHSCNTLVLGDNATLLAIKTLANTAKGQGIGLADELSLSFTNRQGLQILKPMREHLAKEIGLFNQFQGLESYVHPNLTTGLNKNASIDRLTADFIIGLQDEFPSTVSTIVKTAFKIPRQYDAEAVEYCAICRGPVDSHDEFSLVDHSGSRDPLPAHGSLCYACRNIERELDPNAVLPKC